MKPTPRAAAVSPPKRTVEQIAAALRATGGVVAHAAKKLKLDVRTLNRHVARHPELHELLDQLREDMLDQAQSRIAAIIRKPSHPDHAKVAMFILRTLGRKRGFVERHELVGPKEGDTTAGPVKVQFYLPEQEKDDG